MLRITAGVGVPAGPVRRGRATRRPTDALATSLLVPDGRTAIGARSPGLVTKTEPRQGRRLVGRATATAILGLTEKL